MDRARLLSTYSERILENKEVLVKHGRIAAVQPAGKALRSAGTVFYDARGGILAPGLVDPHIHVESSMMTVCAYAEGALLNGNTTIFCDSHEIGNVMDVAGVEAMLEDARQAPLSIFLTVPSTVPATSAALETAGGDLTPDKIAGLTGGADDYLTKPFAMNELLARVNALGRRFAAPPSTILRAGDVTLNVENREVWRGQQRIELSERECALLKVLMREPGRAFSRMELSERVWERAHDYDTKLIEIYIGRLRKKIDEGSAQPFIKTVRHLGYAVRGDSSA